MSSAPQLSYRAQYARRLTREKIFRELVKQHELRGRLPRLPGRGRNFFGGPDEHVPTGPYDLPPRLEQPRDGLRAPQVDLGSFKFCIVGAGVAGLYLAMILSKCGIPYDLLEGSDRVGGRMYTKKFSETRHDYYDIGAMRYPDIPLMKKTFDLFKYLKMPLIPYFLDGVKCPEMYNDILGPPEDPEEFDPYRISVKNGGVVPDAAVEIGAGTLLNKEIKPYKDALKEDFETGFIKLMEMDKYSTRGYLQLRPRVTPKDPPLGGTNIEHGLDFHTIQWLETNNTSSGLFDQAFSETVIDSLDFDFAENVKWWCIDGGTTQVGDAMLKEITTQPEMETSVTRIALKRKTEADSNTKVEVTLVGPSGSEVREYDTVFNTTTLGCAQRMDLTDAELHPAQKDAIRALHYDASSKVGIRFKTAWWITKCGITKGGAASSDLPLRTCVYPSYNLYDDHTKPAVLLASYTWAQDAQRVASLIQPDSPEGENTLLELILRDLARLHAKSGITYKFLCEQYDTHHAFDWYHDPYTSGAFALFGPGQFSNLYPYLTRPAADGKLHFVGEASSAHHAWIVGALDSAERAVMYSLLRFGLTDEAASVEKTWGEVAEVELDEKGTAHLQVGLGCLRTEDTVRVV